jgi:hypothetical protein
MAKKFIKIGASAPWPAPGSLVGFTGDSPGRKKKKDGYQPQKAGNRLC